MIPSRSGERIRRGEPTAKDRDWPGILATVWVVLVIAVFILLRIVQSQTLVRLFPWLG